MSRVLRIAWREYVSFLKTPGFWISLLLAPMMAAFSGFAPGMVERSAPVPVVAVVDLTSDAAASHSPLARPHALTREAGSVFLPDIRKALEPGGGRGRDLALLVPAPDDAWTAATPEAAGAAFRPLLTGEGAGGRHLDAAAVLHGERAKPVLDFWSRNLGDRSLEATLRQAVSEHMRAAALRAQGIDPTVIARADELQPTVRDFSPRAARGEVSLRDRLPVLAAFGMAFMLWALIITGAGILLNSVIEEKANRVLEVLLSSADTHEILGGKILGVAGLSATVMATWVALGLGLLIRTQPGLLGDLAAAVTGHGLLVWFGLYFVMGYLMYAALFAAIGAFCETSREAQTLLGPLMILLTVPMIFLTFAVKQPEAPLIRSLSWFPPFTPFLMTARAASGPPLIELVGALVLMAASAAAVVWVSARAFRAGALSTVKLSPLAGLISVMRLGRAA